MMHQTTVAVVALALVACVQIIRCASIDAIPAVDTVAQKLEDHLQGKNLDNKITTDECRAAFEEFEQLDRLTYRANIHDGPLAVARDYLSDFLHKHLEVDLDGRLTNEFIEKLESAYERARTSYIHKKSLSCEDGATPATPNTCALVASLTGQGEPVTANMIEDSREEMGQIVDQMFAICEENRMYQAVDEFLELFKPYNTAEVDALFISPSSILELLTEESKEKLERGDPEEIQKYMDTYKNELANYFAIVQE